MSESEVVNAVKRSLSLITLCLLDLNLKCLSFFPSVFLSELLSFFLSFFLFAFLFSYPPPSFFHLVLHSKSISSVTVKWLGSVSVTLTERQTFTILERERERESSTQVT